MTSSSAAPWPEIKLRAHSPFEAELIETALEAVGAQAITMEDAADTPILEPLPGEAPLWKDTKVSGIFDQDSDWDDILPQLHQLLPMGLMDTAQTHAIPDQNWIRAWMDQYHPLQFGDRTWIVPTNYEVIDPKAVNIKLDPGLAFGTGMHPTTALCLEWIDQHAQEINKSRILDYGTGSGILAIGALLHNAQHVDAVDIDPQALVATRENANRNQVQAIDCFLPDEFNPTSAYDLVLANILAQPLIDLAPLLIRATQRNGFIVLAGLTEPQSDLVWQHYADSFHTPSFTYQDGWCRITAIKK